MTNIGSTGRPVIVRLHVRPEPLSATKDVIGEDPINKADGCLVSCRVTALYAALPRDYKYHVSFV